MPKTENPKLQPVKDLTNVISPPWCAASPQPHIGGRSEQQDARRIFYDAAKSTILIVVCDGVGGSRSGGDASALVIKTADQLWRERSGLLQNPQLDLLAMSRTAHERICELASVGEKKAPAATIVALYLTPKEAHWIHSGDSRLYRFSRGECVFRTRDHSVVQILLEQGEITEAQMGNHPDQGRLLQSLGTKDFREPAYSSAEVCPSDAFLLCTDGFWERTPASVMTKVLNGESRNLEFRLAEAVKLAEIANGQEGDNVTVAAVIPVKGIHLPPSKRKRLLPFIFIGIGLVVAVVLLAFSRNVPKITTQKQKNPPLAPLVTGISIAPPKPSPTREKTVDSGGDNKGSSPTTPIIPTQESDPIKVDEIFQNIGIRFHRVTLGNSFFYMAETELTEKQWAPATLLNKDKGNLPKCNVSPDDVEEWLKKLNENQKIEEGKWIFRLPTAEEWIATARGPKGNFKYPWGNEGRPSSFGNLNHGNRMPVGQNNDKLDDWPFKDIVGNVTEIVSIRPDASQDQKYVSLGSSYNTQQNTATVLHNLEQLTKELHEHNFLTQHPEWVVEKKDNRRDNLGFRLVLAQVETTQPKPTLTPSSEQAVSGTTQPTQQPPGEEDN